MARSRRRAGLTAPTCGCGSSRVSSEWSAAMLWLMAITTRVIAPRLTGSWRNCIAPSPCPCCCVGIRRRRAGVMCAMRAGTWTAARITAIRPPCCYWRRWPQIHPDHGGAACRKRSAVAVASAARTVPTLCGACGDNDVFRGARLTVVPVSVDVLEGFGALASLREGWERLFLARPNEPSTSFEWTSAMAVHHVRPGDRCLVLASAGHCACWAGPTGAAPNENPRSARRNACALLRGLQHAQRLAARLQPTARQCRR